MRSTFSHAAIGRDQRDRAQVPKSETSDSKYSQADVRHFVVWLKKLAIFDSSAYIELIIGFHPQAPVAERHACAPALKGAAVTQIQSHYFDQTHHVFRPRRREPRACNDNFGSGRRCPQCNKETMNSIGSECRGNGVVQQEWLCATCGHHWATTSRVPS